jgi:hypothetical protein
MEPHRVGDRLYEMNIAGYLFPWEDGAPVLTRMDGGDGDLFLLVFSTRAKLEETLDSYGIGYESIKQIADAKEFLEGVMYESVPRVRIAVDARRDGDVCRFREVIRPPLV